MTSVRIYGMLYEYWIYNKTGKDITIVNVDSKDRITLAGAWGRSNIPTGNFSIVKGVKTDVEKNRFVKRPPENETIVKDDKMRVLLMSQKSTAHKATFNFTVNGKNVSITVQ